jgi:hypothetical protein
VVTRRVLLAASIQIPHFLAKVASSTQALYLIYEFTKNTFTSVVVVRPSNSASMFKSFKTSERSCNFAEVSLYLALRNLISTSFWWSEQTWRRSLCESPTILRFLHDSVYKPLDHERFWQRGHILESQTSIIPLTGFKFFSGWFESWKEIHNTVQVQGNNQNVFHVVTSHADGV